MIINQSNKKETMIRNLLKSIALTAAIIFIYSGFAFGQSRKGASSPVAISVEGSGPGFAGFNLSLFKARFVESLEKKTLYNLHLADEGEKPALRVVLSLDDLQMVGPNEQNSTKNVTRRVQVGVDKDGKPIFENRTIPESVISYQVVSSAKIGATVAQDGSPVQVIGPAVHRRYQRAWKGTSPSPESVTVENIILDLLKSNDWLELRDEVNKVLKASFVAQTP